MQKNTAVGRGVGEGWDVEGGQGVKSIILTLLKKCPNTSDSLYLFLDEVLSLDLKPIYSLWSNV